MGKDRVVYYYDSEYEQAYFGPNHPMKPRPRKAEKAELAEFHSLNYLEFLSRLTPAAPPDMKAMEPEYGIGDDCTAFDGLYDFCRLYAGASIDGARRLNQGLCDIAINWAGGLHHAKKAEASGFCYINDLVLAILELLKFHSRVLYLDIDVHHGDGVEEAFYLNDRVMTVSFHKYGQYFFPMTGALGDVGEKRGKYYSINVPLARGIDDSMFHRIFQPVMDKVMEVFQPEAIVLQCGADSLADDRLGPFMLSLEGHTACVKYMKKFRKPMLVCGGGGYTKSNVARCWAMETAALVGKDLGDVIPPNAYYGYYAPDYVLRFRPKRPVPNENTRLEIDRVKETVLENLRHLAHAPGVQMKEFPPEKDLPAGDIEDPKQVELRLKKYVWEHSSFFRDLMHSHENAAG